MSFLRKSNFSRSTIIVSLADLLQPVARIEKIWPAGQNKETLEQTITSSIIAPTKTEPASEVDLALRQKFSTLPKAEPVKTSTFDRQMMVSWNAWHHAGEVQVSLKGAPESILNFANLTDNDREQIRLQMSKMTKGGHQVLAFAHSKLTKVPANSSEILRAKNLQFDGLVSFSYLPLANLNAVLKQVKKPNQAVKLISGESVEMIAELTAKWGLSQNPDVFDCRQIATIGKPALEMIGSIDLFARVDSESLPMLLDELKLEQSLVTTKTTRNYLKSINPDVTGIKSLNLL